MKKKLEKPYLAEGEVTGHFHELEEGKADVWELEDGSKEFTVKEQTKLTHAEHNVHTIKPGKYVSDIVVEYDPFTDEVRRIAD